MPGGIMRASTDRDADKLSKYKTGEAIRADITKPQNSAFHRKLMALFEVGFDAWEPIEQTHKGQPVQKSFDRYRKDVTIAAGHYDLVTALNGEVRAEAHSLSFARMSPEDREALYSSVIDVLLRYMQGHTRGDIDNQVNHILGFA
jgi:hypothetical protein